MKIKIKEDIQISHDGINVTQYFEGEDYDLQEKWAQRLIDLNVAHEVKAASPVKENKAAKPVKSRKKK